MTQNDRAPVEVSEAREIKITVRNAIIIGAAMISAVGYLYTAQNNLEKTNARQDTERAIKDAAQDAEISSLRDNLGDLKETLVEIKADVKSLLREKKP